MTSSRGVTSHPEKLPGKPEAYRKEYGKAATLFMLVNAS